MNPAHDSLPIIDCDVHIYESPDHPLAPFIPADFRQAVAQGQGMQATHPFRNPHGVDRRDVDLSDSLTAVIGHLDRHRIAYGVLQPQPGYAVSLTPNLDVGSALARAWNDWQTEVALAADDRLLGSVCVNVNDPLAAAKEIRRVGTHPRMVQILIPGENELLYGHRFFDPIYQACEELGLPVALHPGTEGTLSSSTPCGRPSGYFEWHVSLSLTYQAHLASIVIEGTFERFPGLKVMMVEGGVSWLPALLWRMDKDFKALRVTTPWLRQAPSEYVFEHVRLTTQPIEEPARPEDLLHIFRMIQAERTLCFSTDFPHWDFDDPQKAFPRQTPRELLHRIHYANAAELYALPEVGLAETTKPDARSPKLEVLVPA